MVILFINDLIKETMKTIITFKNIWLVGILFWGIALAACAGRPGSRGYQFQDARTYAKWGVDYLKYDWCYDENQSPQGAYRTMSDALKICGRPIVFSICEWGNSEPWKWAKGVGQLWRTTGDIASLFEGSIHWGGLSIVDIIDRNAELYPYAGPGHWNDPDMLQVGNGDLTLEENRSHFTMWCMLAAPLLAGNDLRKMNAEVLNVLTDKDVIAIDQDRLGKQGRRYLKVGSHGLQTYLIQRLLFLEDRLPNHPVYSCLRLKMHSVVSLVFLIGLQI